MRNRRNSDLHHSLYDVTSYSNYYGLELSQWQAGEGRQDLCAEWCVQGCEGQEEKEMSETLEEGGTPCIMGGELSFGSGLRRVVPCKW